MRVKVQETDLHVCAENISERAVKDAIIEQRGHIEGYLRRHPQFGVSLRPWPEDPSAPPIVREMISAGQDAQVGPMAAVAGAVAEMVAKELLTGCDEVIVENGGDIYLSTQHDLTMGIYAGNSPLSLKMGLKICASQSPVAVCTSSGTVGHSLSYGKADAVCVVSKSCALADAGATAIGNRVTSGDAIEEAIAWGRNIPGVLGIVAIINNSMGAWGEVELTGVKGLV